MGGRLALAIGLVTCALLALVPASALAGSAITTALSLPSNVAVGDNDVQGEVIVTNANTPPDGSTTICDHDDTGTCAGSPGITLIPSCSVPDATGCAAIGADPDVFRIDPTATGAVGSACAGALFTVTEISEAFGTVRFDPASPEIQLSSQSQCRISFTFDVLKLPVDATGVIGMQPGLQTRQRVAASAVSDQDESASATASGSVTVKLAAPTLTGTDPSSPGNDNSPEIKGSAPAGTSQVRLYANAMCDGAHVAQGSRDDFASPGFTVSVGDNSTTQFSAIVTDSGGGTSACSTTNVAYEEDSAPPAAPVVADTAPESPANANAPRIVGTAAGTTVHVYANSTCSGAPAAQGSADDFASPGLAVTVADNSTTVFYATTTDGAGNVSPCSTSFATYVEDSIPPAAPTGTSSDPASPSNDNTPQITGSAPAGTTVTLYTNATCTGAPAGTASAATFASQGITVTVADNSTTTFYVTTTDTAGNVSSCTPTGTTYVQDAIAPEPPVLSSTTPASPANDNKPLVRGTAQAGATVRLYADASCAGAPAGEGSAARLQSPGLSVTVADNSTTTFYADATDAAGNPSACSPSSVSYLEDSIAPQTVIDSGPPETGAPSTATFTFSSPDPGVRFECRLDLGAYAACASPHTVSGLAGGSHQFEVRAVDSAGNADASTAGRTFAVAGGTAPPPGAVPPPATRAQPGCLGIKGTLWVGTNGRNLRTGGRGTDLMFGLGGNDALRGQGGLDCLYGGNGIDLLYGASGNDRLYGGAGNDRVDGQAGSDRVSGQSGNDRLYGGAGNDVLAGAAGKDQLVDRRGRDRLSGGAGNDRIDARDATLAGRRGIDVITCGKGIDTVLADRRDRVAKDCEKARLIRRSLPTVSAR